EADRISCRSWLTRSRPTRPWERSPTSTVRRSAATRNPSFSEASSAAGREEDRAMGSRGLAAVVALTAVAAAAPALSDTIYLTNGNTIQVDAWRDVGDAVEFSRGGGILRILKSDIRRIEGTNQSKDLRMYSAPASATAVPTASNSTAPIRETSEGRKEGE